MFTHLVEVTEQQRKDSEPIFIFQEEADMYQRVSNFFFGKKEEKQSESNLHFKLFEDQDFNEEFSDISEDDEEFNPEEKMASYYRKYYKPPVSDGYQNGRYIPSKYLRKYDGYNYFERPNNYRHFNYRPSRYHYYDNYE